MLRPDWTDLPDAPHTTTENSQPHSSQQQPEQQNRGARRGERDCFLLLLFVFLVVCFIIYILHRLILWGQAPYILPLHHSISLSLSHTHLKTIPFKSLPYSPLKQWDVSTPALTSGMPSMAPPMISLLSFCPTRPPSKHYI